MSRECGVVTATVFSMEHERYVEDLCLQRCELVVSPKHVEEVLCNGEIRSRSVNYERITVEVIAHCVVAVYCKAGEDGYEFQRLS